MTTIQSMHFFKRKLFSSLRKTLKYRWTITLFWFLKSTVKTKKLFLHDANLINRDLTSFCHLLSRSRPRDKALIVESESHLPRIVLPKNLRIERPLGATEYNSDTSKFSFSLYKLRYWISKVALDRIILRCAQSERSQLRYQSEYSESTLSNLLKLFMFKTEKKLHTYISFL